MTVSISSYIEGYKFEVISDSWAVDVPYIAVGTDAAVALDSQTLGDHIKSLIDDAWFAKALSVADMLEGYAGKDGLPISILVEEAKAVALIERFAGRDPAIDRMIVHIKAARQKAEYKKAIPRRRQEIQQRYRLLFMEIGRRDGFSCAMCGVAAGDLQIDHLLPLIRGGTNELTNLQLLCGHCNASKGAGIP